MPDTASAVTLQNELHFFSTDNISIDLFPDRETLPYDIFSPHQDIIAERIKILFELQKNRQTALYIISIETLLQKLPHPSFLQQQNISLTIGDTIELANFRRRLNSHGYQSVPQVNEHGEYAFRGSIVDFFPPGYQKPVRVDCLDDEIETLRTFDPETQLSIEKIDQVEILPAREFLLDKESITRFRQQFRDQINSSCDESIAYREISLGHIPGGIEYYLPLFFEKMVSFLDYLPRDTTLVMIGDLAPKATEYWNSVQERHQNLLNNEERPPLEPKYLFLEPSDCQQKMEQFKQIHISDFKKTNPIAVDGQTQSLPVMALRTQYKNVTSDFKNWLNEFEGRTLIVAETAGYREQLLETLSENQIHCKVTDNWQTFLTMQNTLVICVGKINQGVYLEREKIALIADTELLGHKVKQRQHSRPTNTQVVIQNLNNLEIGCPVVHEKHGIGRFQGLEHMDIGGYPAELLVIEYANQDKLYVPVSALHLISRYTSGNAETAPLHQLGGDQWKKSRQKANKKAFDTAAELLDIHARRETAAGISFELNQVEYKKFTEAFPFQETVDQLRAIEEVFDQMKNKKPMDHVVCGDVGFGKTEIAMRAAFVAVENGFQVAVLVPTTLLANQHLQNFLARFADWPIRIAALSRFISPTQQKKTLVEIEKGTMDITIGTHKLLQKNIHFKQLGLIITDEEQRFGVRHKERLKSLSSNADMLTLSATPLPRTLNMTLSGLRTLSIIAVPPPHRYAVKTYVSDWSDELISDACHRELHRGGQVFFIHNKIETIEEIMQKLHQLVPNADIRTAHGKMPEQALENVMLDFYRNKFSILICTTIIESGIDIPTANSIIINQAERFGLAQLHQLRGRVGRSHHRAYAYLLLGKPHSMLPSDAIRRLQAIESNNDLGVGFSLASQDLEIRGAGELLGEEQSGHIQEIGFTLYNQILKRAIDTLRSGKVPDMDKPLNIVTEVNCGESALIPQDYVNDTNIRLVLYRRIAAATKTDELADLKWEIIDRFGLMPEFANHLFINGNLSLLCKTYKVSKIELGAEKSMIEFSENSNIDFNYLITMVKMHPTIYSFTSQQRLIVRKAMHNVDSRVKMVTELLHQISNKAES